MRVPTGSTHLHRLQRQLTHETHLRLTASAIVAHGEHALSQRRFGRQKISCAACASGGAREALRSAPVSAKRARHMFNGTCCGFQLSAVCY